MEGVAHRFLTTNGIKLHFVEKGTGTVVLLLHGFPETWYSWRRQIPVLADAGYRVIAPDLRGYGQSEAPQGSDNYTSLVVVGDLVGLLDALNVEKALVVGHDWGAVIAWHLCLFRPDRVIAYVSLSVHFMPRTSAGSLVQQMRKVVGEDHYICRFQEPGVFEAWVAEQTPMKFMKSVFSSLPSHPLKRSNVGLPLPESLPLLPWISEKEIRHYSSEFERTGFTGPLSYYRALDLTWELMAPWTGAKVMVPTLFMVGDKDLVYGFPGAKDYIHSGAMASDVPNLKDTIILSGVSHFLHEETPKVVNGHILDFFSSILTGQINFPGKL